MFILKMDKYITHHRKPHAKYLNVSEFNQKFNTEIAVSDTFDQKFFDLYNRERKKFGHDEYIVSSLKISAKDDVLGMDEPTPNKVEETAEILGESLEADLTEMVEAEKVEQSNCNVEENSVEKVELEETSVEQTSVEQTSVEQTSVEQTSVEQTSAEETSVEKVELQETSVEETATAVEEFNDESLEEALNDTSDSLQQKIEEIVLERAKTEESANLDLKNIVHFNDNSTNIRDRLMKGTKQNIQYLKNFVDGNTEQTVRLSYKKDEKNIKVSELNPDIESLKAYLSDTKNIREVKCSGSI